MVELSCIDGVMYFFFSSSSLTHPNSATHSSPFFPLGRVLSSLHLRFKSSVCFQLSLSPLPLRPSIITQKLRRRKIMSLPSQQVRDDITVKLGDLVSAIETHPSWTPPTPPKGIYHVWDFVNRSRYIMTELDNILEGKPVKHPEQIPKNSCELLSAL